MLFVITGNGKGKTTSAVGMVARAIGHGEKCAVLQFIKSKPQNCGEFRTLTENGVFWKNYGCGFTWQQDSLKETENLCRQGWGDFKEMYASGDFFLIVLDEFTYVLEEHLIEINEVLTFLIGNNSKTHVVITGRRACNELVEFADTVSEVNEIKHHYNSNGHRCIIGVEY